MPIHSRQMLIDLISTVAVSSLKIPAPIKSTERIRRKTAGLFVLFVLVAFIVVLLCGTECFFDDLRPGILVFRTEIRISDLFSIGIYKNVVGTDWTFFRNPVRRSEDGMMCI